ncbi:MAG: phosphoribosyltransferase family protein [Candidatus Caldarchaeum sp.]|nr:phosphoribosyltransferase family protein [Candidatus Caldarchaeum sp.]MDW7978377.1 phosphoribosyltransferase family protein [Candidatus Caldarchaeum sp.]MDW8359522.1 phosphoribosyltransferase family protein [Candidatus Caldarchaeum sp.]
MGRDRHLQILESLVEGLRTGSSVKVLRRGEERILRISWLNIVHDPETYRALAKTVALDVAQRGYVFDAVASIETSGAKYGVAVSYELNKPYFSIYKSGKVVFEKPVAVSERSFTEGREVLLHLDESAVSGFKRVLLIDDIRRSSRTINAAVGLLKKCGLDVVGCYVILDLAFAGFPKPSEIPYHPLFVVVDVDEEGRCVVSNGLVLRFIEQRQQSFA